MAQDIKPLAAVTGASSGIGYELAKQFARYGYDVIVVAENEAIHQVPAQLEAMGARAEAYQIDLTKREGVEEFYEKIKAFGKPLDAIAINAGVGVGGEFARETSLDEELNVIDLNVRSTVILAKLVSRDMVKRGEGKILFTSSVAAVMPGPLLAVYAASKSFVHSFSQALRNELQDSGVTVTALMPGATETEFFERAHMENTEIGISEKDHPEDVARHGIEALMAGKAKVVAGKWMNSVDVALAQVLPEQVNASQYRAENEKVDNQEKH